MSAVAAPPAKAGNTYCDQVLPASRASLPIEPAANAPSPAAPAHRIADLDAVTAAPAASTAAAGVSPAAAPTASSLEKIFCATALAPPPAANILGTLSITLPSKNSGLATFIFTAAVNWSTNPLPTPASATALLNAFCLSLACHSINASLVCLAL